MMFSPFFFPARDPVKERTYSKEQLLALRPRTSGQSVVRRFDGRGLPNTVYSSEFVPLYISFFLLLFGFLCLFFTLLAVRAPIYLFFVFFLGVFLVYFSQCVPVDGTTSSTATSVCAYYYKCVLILLCVCPHIAG